LQEPDSSSLVFAVLILIAVVSSIRECFGFCAGGSFAKKKKKKKKKVVACMSKASSENSLEEICCVERDTETQTKERRRREGGGGGATEVQNLVVRKRGMEECRVLCLLRFMF